MSKAASTRIDRYAEIRIVRILTYFRQSEFVALYSSVKRQLAIASESLQSKYSDISTYMSTILETALISRGSPVCRPSSLSLGPGSALGEKEKLSAWAKKTVGFASLANTFLIWPRFFAFYELPHCEDWSQPSVCIFLAFKMAAAINIPLSFLLKRWSVSGGFVL